MDFLLPISITQYIINFVILFIGVVDPGGFFEWSGGHHD